MFSKVSDVDARPDDGRAVWASRSNPAPACDGVLRVADPREVVESASWAQSIFDGDDGGAEDVAAFRWRLRVGIAGDLLFDQRARRRQRFDQALQLAMTFVSIRNRRGVVVLHGEMSVWVWTHERAVREESQVLLRIFLVKRVQ